MNFCIISNTKKTLSYVEGYIFVTFSLQNPCVNTLQLSIHKLAIKCYGLTRKYCARNEDIQYFWTPLFIVWKEILRIFIRFHPLNINMLNTAQFLDKIYMRTATFLGTPCKLDMFNYWTSLDLVVTVHGQLLFITLSEIFCTTYNLCTNIENKWN